MATQTKSHLRINRLAHLYQRVSSCSTLFHEAIKSTRNDDFTISHHPRVREGGAKPPRYSFIIMRNLIPFVLLLLFVIPAQAAPLWIETRIDSITLWFTPPSQRALLAANIALERAQTAEDLDQIYAVQDLLTIIEQNLNIQGNPHKALRTQQEVEARLRLLQEKMAELQGQKNEEQYGLVLLHTSLRVDLILQETELVKEKTRAKLNQDKKLSKN